MADKDISDDLLKNPARIEALRKTGLLDSPDEEAFDSLTRLICKNMQAPMALVTLIDEDRQFFKSQAGLAIVEREAPLSHSICKFVVREKEIVVIEDVRTHPFTLDKLALPGMGFMAYCGIPLMSDGEVIGSLCGVDNKPREWTEDQISALEDIAIVAMLQITAYKLRNKP